MHNMQDWVRERLVKFLGDDVMKKMTKAMLMTALILGSVQWGGTTVHAEELHEFTLDPMVVTAQRMEMHDLDTPVSIDVLTNKDMVESGANNVFEALKLNNGIMAYGYGDNGQSWGGMCAKVLIRGNDKGTLVMVDGSPINMNNVYFLNTIPVDSVERVEIVKGASSVLYGSEASGGVINIITKKNMANSISVTKGEYGKTKESVSLGLGKLGIAANFEQGDELKGLSSNGRAMNDGDKASVLWKYKFDDKWTFTHQHTENDYNFNQYNTSNWKTLKELASYEYKEDFARLQYQDDSVKGNLYYNRSDRKNYQYYGTGKAKKLEDMAFDTIGMDLQKEYKTKFADIIVGTTVEHQTYSNDNPISGGNVVNNIIDADADTYALFVQAKKDLGNDYTLTVGAREQFMKANDNYDAFTPEFALMKKLDDNSSLYVNAAKAFKMPNFTALYGSGAVEFIPNPNLKPEEGWTYELGYKKASESSMFKAALYYIDMDAWSYEDVEVNGQTVKKPINSPFENVGIEFNYEKMMDKHFSYSLGIDISNPKEKPQNEGPWKRKYAREQYTGSLKYQNRDFNAAFSGSITADRAGGWKDKMPMNLYMGYKVSNNSRVDLVCENILDRKDIVSNWTSASSTEYYAMPRNVRVTYTYTF